MSQTNRNAEWPPPGTIWGPPGTIWGPPGIWGPKSPAQGIRNSCRGFVGLAGASRPPMIYEPFCREVEQHPSGDFDRGPGKGDYTKEGHTATLYNFHSGPVHRYMRAKKDWVVVAWTRNWFEGYYSPESGLQAPSVAQARRLGLSRRTARQLARINGGRVFYPGTGREHPTWQSQISLCAVYCHRREAEVLLDYMQSILLQRFESTTAKVVELAGKIASKQVHPDAMVGSARRLDAMAAERLDQAWRIAMLGRSECREVLVWLEQHSLAMMTLNNVPRANRDSP